MSINYDELISDLKELCSKHNVVLTTVEFSISHTETLRLPSGTPGCAEVKETGKHDINIVITEFF